MKKGFTLIELLAVIIILAVIALIATPIILNVVNNAKESARKSSVTGYADAVKLARTEAQFNNLPFNDNDLSDLSIETNTNNVRCSEVKFDITVGVMLTGCYVDDYTDHAYNYSRGVVTPDVPDNNAPIVTAKLDINGVTNSISSYFDIDNNGNGIITNITCTDGNNTVTLVSQLGYGSNNVTCTATKANGLSHSASTIINSTEEISTAVLNKFPQLALGNTADKGCATPGTDNYTYLGGCYLTGAQTNNYIWFNGFLYRIMGINKDNSIRLISEETITSLARNNAVSTDTYTQNFIKTWLNDEFLNNTSTNSALNNNIVNQTFCAEDYNTTGTSRTTCTTNLDTNPTQKVGLISIDEYNLAGASTSYLNDGQLFATISPSDSPYFWAINYNGIVASTLGHADTNGIRPLININEDTLITSGNGSTNKYFVLGETKNNSTGTLLSTAKAGEYVKFANKIYRVVSNDSNGTKLILDGYVDYNNDGIIDDNDKIIYGENGTNVPTCYLMTEATIINWLVPTSDTTNRNKLQSTTWYQGLKTQNVYNYKLSSLATTGSTTYTGTFGLIRIGELLSSQSYTISSKKWYWSITPYDGSHAWYIRDTGNANGNGVPGNVHAVIRPVINVNSATSITTGNGLPDTPYEI